MIVQCVIGSRSLARLYGVRDAAWKVLDGLGGYDAYFSGAAVGPDTWGFLHAVQAGKPAARFELDGTLPGGEALGWGPRWTPESPPPKGAPRDVWKRWCLHRDSVMMGHAWELVRADDHDVRILALVDPESQTHGTGHTVTEALRLGLKPVVLEWDRRGCQFRATG